MYAADPPGADDPDAGFRRGRDGGRYRGPAESLRDERSPEIPGRDLDRVGAVRQGGALLQREADPQPALEHRDHRRTGSPLRAGVPLSRHGLHRRGLRQAMRDDSGLQGDDGAARRQGVVDGGCDLQTAYGQHLTWVYFFLPCGRSRIGTGARLRTVWRKPWRFESSRPHKYESGRAAARTAAMGHAWVTISPGACHTRDRPMAPGATRSQVKKAGSTLRRYLRE